MENKFQRLELLLGKAVTYDIANVKVILFGVGGVGSWCADALIRSGITHLTLIDSDIISVTNINRQLQADTRSVGKVKVTELANRLKLINPDATIIAEHKKFDRTTRDSFNLSKYDYVVDAIDSLGAKVDLIEQTLNAQTVLFSSLGAAGKMDPAHIKIADIWKTKNCRLGRFVRKRLRKRGISRSFLCVYSDEFAREPVDLTADSKVDNVNIKSSDYADDSLNDNLFVDKKQINGSVVHITAPFGFYLAGLLLQDIENRN